MQPNDGKPVGSVIGLGAMLWFAERQTGGREHWALVDAVSVKVLKLMAFETQRQCLVAKGDYLRLIQSQVKTNLEPSGMITSNSGWLTLSCITLADVRGLHGRMSEKTK